MKQSIEQAVRVFAETKLEQVRGEIRTSEERLKSDLRTKEAEIENIRSGAVGGRSELAVILHKRRVQAIEGLWNNTIQLSKLQMPAIMLSMLKVENIEKMTPGSSKMREFLGLLVPDDITIKLGDIKADQERPFLSEYSWSLYSAYQIIIVAGYARIKILSIGIENSQNFLQDGKIKELIKTVLPHQSNWIETHGEQVAYHLLEELRNKLLIELKRDLDNPASDKENVERSANIMKQVADISREAAQQNLGTPLAA